jgi:hypothetical protein
MGWTHPPPRRGKLAKEGAAGTGGGGAAGGAARARAAGGLLKDAAPYSSVEELLVLARDRKGWQASVHALLPAQERVKKKKKGRKESDSQGCGFDSDGHLQQVF